MPAYMQMIYKLILIEGYRPRQNPLSLMQGQLVNIYHLTLKKKHKPIIRVALWSGRV